MAELNLIEKTIECKIVYYGPGRGGKTTNLEYIFDRFKKNTLGDLVSVSTRGDRTLFFDFLPIGLGKLNGFEVKVKLFTVPGQQKYSSTRKMVLRGVDGIVFVADSLKVREKYNRLALKDLQDNLAEYGKDIRKIPLIFQYNKRDLKTEGIPITPVNIMDSSLNSQLKAPYYVSSAVKGKEVGSTLKHCLKLTLRQLYRDMNTSS